MDDWYGVSCYQNRNGENLRIKIANTSGEWHLLTLDEYSKEKIQPKVELLPKKMASGTVLALAEYLKTVEASPEVKIPLDFVHSMIRDGFLCYKDGDVKVTRTGWDMLQLAELFLT